MSFVMSQLAGHLLSPTGMILALAVIALLLQTTPWRRLGAGLALTVAGVLVAIGLLPVGQLLLQPLENRFPAEPPTR